MKKQLIIISLFIFILFVGCTKDDSNPTSPGGGGVSAPINVTLVSTGGTSLTFSWTEVTNADSYRVSTPNYDTIILAKTISHTHNNITTLGYYKVLAYDGNDSSAWSESKCSSPIQYTNIKIGSQNSTTLASCYRWYTDGHGDTIFVGSFTNPNQNAKDNSDIFLYYDNSILNIVSATNPPLNGSRQTHISYRSQGNLQSEPWAPSSGYNNFEQAHSSGVYWLENTDGRYIKVNVTTVNTIYDITFSYLYQPIQGFRGAW